MKSLILITYLLLAVSAHADQWPYHDPDCLAANIYHEARGENIYGQWLVAYVTQNRVKSNKYPNTYCKVVKQYLQFSWWDDPRIKKLPKDRIAWETAKDIAWHFIIKDEISQYDASLGALYYHSVDVHPEWAERKEYIGRIGRHLAYR